MDFLTLAGERYSLRSMDGRAVPRETVAGILEAARLAPTAVNLQRQRLLIIDDPEGLEKVRRCTPCHFNSSCVLALCFQELKVPDDPAREADMHMYGLIDSGIIIAHMTLQARAAGVDSTIVGRFDRDMLRSLFDIPDGITPALLLPLGYPAPGAGPSERHEQRFPLSEFIIYGG